MTVPSARATAELRKLAHALDVPVDRLTVVAELPADELRALRSQVSDALFEADRHYFSRVAALAKAVPAAVAAKLAEVVLPPLIAARTAELIEPARAVDMVGRLSESYLAEVALRMDASRAAEVVAAIPPERVATVARELARRAEWVVIGSFVTQVSAPALAASVAEFSGEQLLRIGFVLEDLARLDEIADLLGKDQVDGMVSAAASLGLWAELGELVTHLSAPRRARLAAAYGELPAAERVAFTSAVERGELPADVLSALAG